MKVWHEWALRATWTNILLMTAAGLWLIVMIRLGQLLGVLGEWP